MTVQKGYEEICHGTLAELLANNPALKAGQFGYVTDTKRLVGPADGTTKALGLGSLGPYANVKDFGAIGDGSSHPLSGYFGSLAAAQAVYPHAVALTDELDWAAIQAAINFFPAPGGPVYMPPGTYKLTRGLVCRASTRLKGAGYDNGNSAAELNPATKLDAAGISSGTVIAWPSNSEAARGEDFVLLGPTVGPVTSVGINPGASAWGFYFRNVLVMGFNCGWYTAQANVGTLLNCGIQNTVMCGLLISNGSQINVIGGNYQNSYNNGTNSGWSYRPGNIVILGGNVINLWGVLIDETFRANTPSLYIAASARMVTVRDSYIITTGNGYGIQLGNGADAPAGSAPAQDAPPASVTIENCYIEPFSGSPDPLYCVELRGTGHRLVHVVTAPRAGGDIHDEIAVPGTSVTMTNGSTAVTGTGTTWKTGSEKLLAGMYLRLTADGDTAYAKIASVADDTHLTLAANYTGTGGTGAALYSGLPRFDGVNGFAKNQVLKSPDGTLYRQCIANGGVVSSVVLQ